MEQAGGVEEVRAVLAAYKLVKDASWPALHPAMARQSGRWALGSEVDLRAELAGYLQEASVPACSVRVFWKTGRDFTFAGCNEHFARDAGFGSSAELVGLNDFSDKVPWQAQAAKYRFDDKEIVDSGQAKLDILERQASATGVVWVLVGKAPVRMAAGQAIGIFGMYQLIDADTAKKLFAERSRKGL
jgi:hypothetical protein